MVKVTILDRDKDLKPEMSAKVTFFEPEKSGAAAGRARGGRAGAARGRGEPRRQAGGVPGARGQGVAERRRARHGAQGAAGGEGGSLGRRGARRPPEGRSQGRAPRSGSSRDSSPGSAARAIGSRGGGRRRARQFAPAGGEGNSSGEASMAMVDVRSVTKVYRRDAEELVVLNGLSLQVQEGDFAALMGPSGSGKSTLLNLIAGIDQPDRGRRDGRRHRRRRGSARRSWPRSAATTSASSSSSTT